MVALKFLWGYLTHWNQGAFYVTDAMGLPPMMKLTPIVVET